MTMLSRFITTSIFGMTLLTVLTATAAVTPPQIGDQTIAPIAAPYDTASDADAAVSQAFATAKAQRKRVLLDLGGNWCPDCRVMAGVMANPDVAKFIQAHFVVVMVDVGRFTKNTGIAKRYGVTLNQAPTVLIIDPTIGNGITPAALVNSGKATDLSNARDMSPQAIVDWLAGWSA